MKSKTYKNRKKKPSTSIYDHIVFFTKYNRPLLKGPIQPRTRTIIRDALEDLECRIIDIRVFPNRVHISFEYPPRLSVAQIMGKVKGKSSYLLRKEFPELTKKNPKALWAPKYGMLY